MEKKIYDVAIIGAGPAGLTAALYAMRAGFSTVIFEGDAPGGKLVKTFSIENWPGVQDISGADLSWNMYSQVLELKPDFIYSVVKKVTLEDDIKVLHYGDSEEVRAKVLIVASGTKERLMNVPGEKEMIGKGISFCAVCDSAFYKDKDVIVVGGGNSALEESIYLARTVRKITIVIRRDVFRAEEYIQEQVLANDKIEVLRNKKPHEVLIENGKVAGLLLEDSQTGEITTLRAEGIFPYIGNIPVTAAVRDLGIVDEKGYLVVDEKMQTAVPGIIGAGDVCQKSIRQITTAVGDGAKAVHAVNDYLMSLYKKK